MFNDLKFNDYCKALDAKIKSIIKNQKVSDKQLKELENLQKVLSNFQDKVPFKAIDITQQKTAIETIQRTYQKTNSDSKDGKKVVDSLYKERRNTEDERKKEAEIYGKELLRIANKIFCSSWSVNVNFTSGISDYATFQSTIKRIVMLGYDKLGLKYDVETIKAESVDSKYETMLEELNTYQKMINSGETSELSFKTPKGFNPSKAVVKSREVIKKLSDMDRRLKSIDKAIIILEKSENVKFPETIKLLESIKTKEDAKFNKAEEELKKLGIDTIQKSVEEKKAKDDKERDIKNAASILAKMQDLDPNSEEYREYQELLREYHLSESEYKQAEYEGNKQNYIRNEVFRSLKMDGTIPSDKEIKDLNLNEKNILDIRTREAIQMGTEEVNLNNTLLNNTQPIDIPQQDNVSENVQKQEDIDFGIDELSIVDDKEKSERRKEYMRYRQQAILDGEEPMSYKGYQAYQEQRSEERFLR